MAIPTKIPKLNNLLFGGFPEGSTILVKYREMSLARALIPFLIDKGVCITTDAQPADIGGELKFIDAYSLERGLTPRKEDRVVSTAGAINDISLDLSEELRNSQSPSAIVFSASTLLKRNPSDAVYNFLSVFSARIKEKSGAFILFANTEDISRDDLEKIEAMSNLVFNIEKGEEGVHLTSNAYPAPLEVVMFSGSVTVR